MTEPPRKKKRPAGAPGPKGAKPGGKKPRPKPTPKTSDRRFVATVGGAGLAVVLGLAGTWWATRPEVPGAASPYPTVELAAPSNGSNAVSAVWRANYDMKLTREQHAEIARWSRHRWDGAPPARVVALRASAAPRALAGLAEARRRTIVQQEGEGDRSNLRGIQHVTNLALLETRLRLADPTAREPLRPAIDALTFGRRLLYAPGTRAVAAMLAHDAMGTAADVLVDPATGALRRPTPELAAALKELNAAAGLARPVGQVLAGVRDDDWARWTDPATGKRPGQAPGPLDHAFAWFLGPTIQADGRAFYDEAIAAYDARRFDEAEAVFDRMEAGLTPVQWVFHPIHGCARLVVGSSLNSIGRGTVCRMLDAEARFQAARVAIAAELHRRGHGASPATLAELVPALLPAVPEDPYRPGKPLGWSGGRLWSAAWDTRDDGGRALVRRKLKHGSNDYTVAGDAVLLPPTTFALAPWAPPGRR